MLLYVCFSIYALSLIMLQCYVKVTLARFALNIFEQQHENKEKQKENRNKKFQN